MSKKGAGKEDGGFVTASGKKKGARAFALLKSGEGRLYVNGLPIEVYAPNEFIRMRILEPLWLVPDHAKSVDIKVKVKGGGFMSQAEATRTAVGRAILKWTESEALRTIFREYDRSILVGDFRRKEPKKPGRKGARARYQKSYR